MKTSYSYASVFGFAFAVATASAQQFSEVSATAGMAFVPATPGVANSSDPWHIMSVNWVDINGDGWDDLYVTPHAYYKRKCSPSLYINNQNGTFTESNAMWAGEPDPFSGDNHLAFFGDYDGDGDQDLYKSNGGGSGSGTPLKRHLGRNEGTFLKKYVSGTSGGQTLAEQMGLSPMLGSGRSGMFFDYDNDGRLDLFASTGAIELRNAINDGITGPALDDYLAPSILYRQNEDGTFTDTAATSGFDIPGYAFFGVVTDLKGDGVREWVIFDGDENDADPRDAINDGDFLTRVYTLDGGVLEDVTAQYPRLTGFHGRDAVVADFNGDLVPDILAVGRASTSPQIPVYYEWDTASSNYVNKTTAAGFTEAHFAMSMIHGDFDNDGDLDICIFNQGKVVGGSNTSYQPVYYRNNGSGTFSKVTGNEGISLVITGSLKSKDFNVGTCVAVSDYNRDGFLDFYTNAEASEVSDGALDELNQPPRLFKNNGNANHWLQVDLVGKASNRDAVGARVFIMAGDKPQMREAQGRMRRTGQDSKRLHFGLGTAQTVTGIVVDWPSGARESFNGRPADQIILLTEGTGTPLNYKAWMLGYNWPSPGVDDQPEADPNGDGVPNLFAYASSLSPLGEAARLPILTLALKPNDSALELVFRRRAGDNSDINYAILESLDIGITDPWEAVEFSGESGNLIESLGTVPDSNGTAEWMKATLPMHSPTVFYKLEVDLQPGNGLN